AASACTVTALRKPRLAAGAAVSCYRGRLRVTPLPCVRARPFCEWAVPLTGPLLLGPAARGGMAGGWAEVGWQLFQRLPPRCRVRCEAFPNLSRSAPNAINRSGDCSSAGSRRRLTFHGNVEAKQRGHVILSQHLSFCGSTLRRHQQRAGAHDHVL